MTIGKVCLSRPEVRKRLLRTLAATGNMTRAAKAAGVTLNAVNYQRTVDKGFDARVRAATATATGGGPVRTYRTWDEATCKAFLVELAEHGSVARAATVVGGSQAGVYDVRNRDSEFAYAWSQAKLQAQDRIEDALFDGALNGYVEIRTAVDGATTTVHRQRPDIMLKLVARRDAGRTRFKTIELSPQVLESARRKLEHRTRTGIAQGLAAHMEAAEAKERAAAIDIVSSFPPRPEPEIASGIDWREGPVTAGPTALAPEASTP